MVAGFFTGKPMDTVMYQSCASMQKSNSGAFFTHFRFYGISRQHRCQGELTQLPSFGPYYLKEDDPFRVRVTPASQLLEVLAILCMNKIDTATIMLACGKCSRNALMGGNVRTTSPISPSWINKIFLISLVINLFPLTSIIFYF